MRHRARCLAALLVAGVVIAACDDTDKFLNLVPTNSVVRIEDQCDSASFNAALGAGTCVKAGFVTYAAFTAELAATQRVATWRFAPEFSLRVGQSVSATNYGGEDHTFTEVLSFGGGIVPALNTASGNLVVAPECALLLPNDHIPPGATFTTGVANVAGTRRFQCCIHPWMRAAVTVNP